MSNQKNKDVVLFLEDKKQHSKVIILPVVGETEIDEQGRFTIDDVTASLLLNSGSGFLLVEGNGTTVDEKNTAENKKSKPKKVEKEEVKEEDEEEEEEDEEDGLDELELADLIALADASFEKESYKKFTKSKKMMVNFLRKNS